MSSNSILFHLPICHMTLFSITLFSILLNKNRQWKGICENECKYGIPAKMMEIKLIKTLKLRICWNISTQKQTYVIGNGETSGAQWLKITTNQHFGSIIHYYNANISNEKSTYYGLAIGFLLRK